MSKLETCIKEVSECKHERTQMWEPHLAGARKCLDCGWVKNPNRAHFGEPLWFNEDKELEEKERKELARLKDKYEEFIGGEK